MEKLVRTPRSLFGASLLIWIAVPLTVAEVVLYLRAPSWDLPLDQMFKVGMATTVLASVFFIPLLRASRSAFVVLSCFGALWCLFSIGAAISLEHFWLGLFSLGLILYWVVLILILKRELSRSYLDSKMAWYQGLPRIIPGVQCRIEGASSSLPISRIDRDGVYILNTPIEGHGERAQLSELKSKKRHQVEFRFRDGVISCTGQLIQKLESDRGFGLQFTKNPPDQVKELGDLVERLRGEGYVS